jgi:hypothetical protein
MTTTALTKSNNISFAKQPLHNRAYPLSLVYNHSTLLQDRNAQHLHRAVAQCCSSLQGNKALTQSINTFFSRQPPNFAKTTAATKYSVTKKFPTNQNFNVA